MDSWHTELTVALRTALLEECFDAASVYEDGVLASGQTSSVVQWKISTVRPAVIAALVDLQQSVLWCVRSIARCAALYIGLVKYGSVLGPARKDVLMCCGREDYFPHVAASPQACWVIQILRLDTGPCGSPCHRLTRWRCCTRYPSPAGDYQNQNPTSAPTTPPTLNNCYSDTRNFCRSITSEGRLLALAEILPSSSCTRTGSWHGTMESESSAAPTVRNAARVTTIVERAVTFPYW
jgi:hypothetical protein